MKSILPYHSVQIFLKTKSPNLKSDGLTSVILCSTMLEAFLQDIASWYSFVNKAKTKIGDFERTGAIRHLDGFSEISSREIEILEFIENLDKDNESLTDRYYKLYLFLTDKEWSRGAEPYQDFYNLISIRNSVTHLKTEPLKIDKETGKVSREALPKPLRNLGQKGVLSLNNMKDSWIDSLSSNKFVEWCQLSSLKIIDEIFHALPNQDITKMFQQEYLYALGIDIMTPADQ